jgi:hypothetical protein
METAKKETFRNTVGGKWVEATIIRAIAKLNHVKYGDLLDEMELAESDSGKYICDPSFEGPEKAPDEE